MRQHTSVPTRQSRVGTVLHGRGPHSILTAAHNHGFCSHNFCSHGIHMGVNSPSLHSTHICNLVPCCVQADIQASFCLTSETHFACRRASLNPVGIWLAFVSPRTPITTYHNVSRSATSSHRHVELPHYRNLQQGLTVSQAMPDGRACHVVPRVNHARYALNCIDPCV